MISALDPLILLWSSCHIRRPGLALDESPIRPSIRLARYQHVEHGQRLDWIQLAVDRCTSVRLGPLSLAWPDLSCLLACLFYRTTIVS